MVSEWWALKEKKKKKTQSSVSEKGADMHLSHSEFLQMYSKLCIALKPGLTQENIDTGELRSASL